MIPIEIMHNLKLFTRTIHEFNLETFLLDKLFIISSPVHTYGHAQDSHLRSINLQKNLFISIKKMMLVRQFSMYNISLCFQPLHSLGTISIFDI